MNVGRNTPCPCGSGAKFKKCHGAKLNTTDRPVLIRIPEGTAAVVIDPQDAKAIALHERLAINHMARDARTCEQQFDRFFEQHLLEFSRAAAINTSILRDRKEIS